MFEAAGNSLQMWLVVGAYGNMLWHIDSVDINEKEENAEVKRLKLWALIHIQFLRDTGHKYDLALLYKPHFHLNKLQGYERTL